MALSAFSGAFAVSNTGSLAVTGVGFQPKAVIILFPEVTGALTWMFGAAASSTQEWVTTAWAADGSGTANSESGGFDANTVVLRVGASLLLSADFSSMDSDGFTLNVSSIFGGPYGFDYLALGGSDLTNVAAGVTQVPASGASHAVTGAGFQPDLVIFGFAGLRDWPASGTFAGWGIGAMTATAQGGFTSRDEHGANTMQTMTYQLSTAVVPFAVADAQLLLWSRSSLDSDGFTLTLDDLGPIAGDLGWLAMKFTSASWVKMGVETQPTSASTKQTSGLGLTPSGLLFFGSMLASSTGVSAEGSATVGASDGTNNRSIAVCNQDAVPNSNTATRVSTTKSLQRINGSGTMASEASVSAVGSGTFDLNWSTADAVAREFFYIAMGAPVSAETFVPRVMVL